MIINMCNLLQAFTGRGLTIMTCNLLQACAWGGGKAFVLSLARGCGVPFDEQQEGETDMFVLR